MNNQNQKITLLFNFGVMVYLCISIGILELFEPMDEKKVPFDLFFDSVHPFIGCSVTISIILFVAIFGAIILKTFWNRLIVDIFKLRNIDFQEALAICLVLGSLAS